MANGPLQHHEHGVVVLRIEFKEYDKNEIEINQNE